MYSDPTENEETLHHSIFFMPIKPFANVPEPLKRHDSPWLEVFMHALIQVEDNEKMLRTVTQ
jgi:hypothetical protein